MNKPEEVLEIMLNGCNISDIQEEDLKHFPNITYVDLGENSELTISKLQHLAQLREIHLYCNSITNISIPDNCFGEVEVCFCFLIISYKPQCFYRCWICHIIIFQNALICSKKLEN